MAKKKQTTNEKKAHHSTAGEIDGIGGAGGSSGAGSVSIKPKHISDVSGVDAELRDTDVPVPGSTGHAGPSNAREGHTDGGMSGKTRGSSSETEPSRSSDNE